MFEFPIVVSAIHFHGKTHKSWRSHLNSQNTWCSFSFQPILLFGESFLKSCSDAKSDVLWLCRVGGKSERSSLQRKEFWAASKQKQCIALSSRSKSVQSKWNQRLCLLLPKNFYQLVSITIVCKNAAHQFPSKNAILKFSLVFNLFCNLLKISNAWDCNLFNLTLFMGVVIILAWGGLSKGEIFHNIPLIENKCVDDKHVCCFSL